MASACVNSSVGISTESFVECPAAKRPSIYGWVNQGVSSTRHFHDDNRTELDDVEPEKTENLDPDYAGKEFEFHLEDPVSMLPADELFADGKLVPLRLSATRQSTASGDFRPTEAQSTKFRVRNEISSSMDPCLFSPKPPSCSIRWKELLGLKKLQQNSNARTDHIPSSHRRSKISTRSLKHFLQRGSNSNAPMDSSLNLPLLQELDNDELPPLSFDSDIPSIITRNTNPSEVGVVKHRASVPPSASRNPATPRVPESTVPQLSISVDSPRMNPSGKIVFHGLERSSSSPSSFIGGPRYKHRGMERSYSAKVRASPVLNVPVGSLRGSSKSGVFGFPLFSSTQNRGYQHYHHQPNKNRITPPPTEPNRSRFFGNIS